MLDRPPVSSSTKPTDDQLLWITVRDRVGEAIDSYLRERPSAEMRHVLEDLEADLRAGDHAVGLL